MSCCEIHSLYILLPVLSKLSNNLYALLPVTVDHNGCLYVELSCIQTFVSHSEISPFFMANVREHELSIIPSESILYVCINELYSFHL